MEGLKRRSAVAERAAILHAKVRTIVNCVI